MNKYGVCFALRDMHRSVWPASCGAGHQEGPRAAISGDAAARRRMASTSRRSREPQPHRQLLPSTRRLCADSTKAKSRRQAHQLLGASLLGMICLRIRPHHQCYLPYPCRGLQRVARHTERVTPLGAEPRVATERWEMPFIGHRNHVLPLLLSQPHRACRASRWTRRRKAALRRHQASQTSRLNLFGRKQRRLSKLQLLRKSRRNYRRMTNLRSPGGETSSGTTPCECSHEMSSTRRLWRRSRT